MNKRVDTLYDSDYESAIRELTSKSSDFKANVYKRLLMNDTVSTSTINTYLSYVNSFINTWETYAFDLKGIMKDNKPAVGEYQVLDYDCVKESIYAKHDYASILEFADGVLEGISSGKFKTPEDIKDFKDHTAHSAFNIDDSEVASVLDNTLDNGMNNHRSKCDALAIGKYNAVRTYDNLFNSKDGNTLYKSIDKTVQFISDEKNIEKYVPRTNMRLFISVLNNVMDYMTLSLTVYACRIFTIVKYAKPFFNYSASMTESVENKDDEKEHKSRKTSIIKDSSVSSRNIETRYIIDADDAICRDLSKIKEFYDVFLNFLHAIGANTVVNSTELSFTSYFYNTATINNPFCKKLTANGIHDYFSTSHMIGGSFNHANEDAVASEMNQTLKSFMYNPNQAIQGSVTAKNELFHVIRGTEPESNTIDGYRQLAVDLYVCSITILRNMVTTYDQIATWKAQERLEPRQHISTTNIYSECAKMISELYRDLSMAVLQKARDIEMQINRLKNAEIDKTELNLRLDVPGLTQEEITDSSMTPVVPDTTRMPVDLMDLYALPAFESYQMYDEYLRTLPEFADDAYLSEALDTSTLWNTIFSGILALGNKIMSFFRNKSVQAAFNYVKTHKNELLSMTFNGSMSVLPYLTNVDLTYAKNFADNLNKFDEKVLESSDTVNRFLMTLYPNETTYSLFNADNANRKTAAESYRNTILFGKTDNIQDLILDTSEKIRKEMLNWVGTLEQGDTLFKNVQKWTNDMSQGFKSVRNKIVPIQNKAAEAAKNNNANNAAAAEPPKIDANAQNQNATPATTPAQPSTQSTTATTNNQNVMTNTNINEMITLLTTGIQRAMINIAYPLQGIIIQIIRDEYKYIQEAYSIGSKAAAPQNNTVENNNTVQNQNQQ